MEDYTFDISNVLIVGCGGAGLRAAIEARNQGLCVKVLGKRIKNDSHTVLAAGGINAAFGNVDKDDSWKQHFADTYLEGYGIGDSRHIELMAKESLEAVNEIDNWGANLQKLANGKLDQRFFGAHTFRRTCYSGDYTGQSILFALLKKIKNLSIPVYDKQYVTDLLIKDNCCFGAMSFNYESGERTVHYADAVILCTGGHTRIWKKSSSRKQENNGDGFSLGLKAGCSLIDMEMVQFHPTGMVLPEEIAGTLVTEAVRGEGGKLFNANGDRFMINYDKERMELSTRDKVAFANYTEIAEGRGTPNGGVYLDISHMNKEFIIKKIPKIFRQFIEGQMLDISKEPMEVAPTAHYSMGGLKVDAENHQTTVNGLFAAGEVVGGLHGANRLGGNSLAEILVFGKRAGSAASDYSKNLEHFVRSKKVICKCNENIEKLIKKGNELVIPLQNELSEIMWSYCGVVKDKNNLNIGLKKLQEIKKRSQEIDVRVNDNNYQDLINTFDFKASLVSAESTIISSIEREESRGAHQRRDFPEISTSGNYNIEVKLVDNKINLTRLKLEELNINLRKIIEQTSDISSFKGRLLE